MSPTGYETGKNNADLLVQFGIWNRKYNLGIVCDSSTGFILANGAIRSPRSKLRPETAGAVPELRSGSNRVACSGMNGCSSLAG